LSANQPKRVRAAALVELLEKYRPQMLV